jgi:AraC-like DNA-binding protein
LLCKSSRLDDLGLPGRLARCAPTVGQGLVALARAYNLRRGGGLVEVIEDGGFARLVFAIAMPGTHDTRHYQMGAIAIAFNVLEDLCGTDWQASEVRFAFRSPANLRPFKRFFLAPLHFDASESAIVFESGWLARTLPPVDDSFRQAVATEIRRNRELAFEDFPALVRDLIRRQVSSGPCSIETVSGMLSMHRRSLERRLKGCGASYSALQKSVKHEIAVQLLRETALSVQQIADFLRYSSAANFATAFRRWTDRTPKEFRAAGS